MQVHAALLSVMVGLLLSSAGAAAGQVPADLVGVWSQDAGCAADAMTVVLSAETMEVLQEGERRSLSEVDASGTSPRPVELRATKIVFVRQPNPAPPEPGDTLRFRREGDLLRLLALTEHGKLVELADSTVFHRCRR